MERSGEVVRKLFAAGSKSERQAVMLQSEDGEHVLRIRGGNPFRDPRLEALVGKRIRARGQLQGYTFIMDEWGEE